MFRLMRPDIPHAEVVVSHPQSTEVPHTPTALQADTIGPVDVAVIQSLLRAC